MERAEAAPEEAGEARPEETGDRARPPRERTGGRQRRSRERPREDTATTIAEDASLEAGGGDERAADAGSVARSRGEDRPRRDRSGGGRRDREPGERTRDVLIESAQFAPSVVRLTARRHGLQTEASYRFERGVDRAGIVRFGSAYAPLDEALARTVVDFSGRPWPQVDLGLKREMLGALSTENVGHVLQSLAIAARSADRIGQVAAEIEAAATVTARGQNSCEADV